MAQISITPVQNGKQEEAIRSATSNGARSLAGGLNVPEGTHSFLVAEKNAFGILNVKGTASGDWALPIVAGTMNIGEERVAFTLSSKPGEKTLVVADNFYVQMKPNTAYIITVELRKGRKMVTNVSPADTEENFISSSQVEEKAGKEKKAVAA